MYEGADANGQHTASYHDSSSVVTPHAAKVFLPCIYN